LLSSSIENGETSEKTARFEVFTELVITLLADDGGDMFLSNLG
jgi:hypothetical protein